MNLEHLKLGGPVNLEEDLAKTEAPTEELTPEQKEAIPIIEETALMGRKPDVTTSNSDLHELAEAARNSDFNPPDDDPANGEDDEEEEDSEE